VDKAEEPEKMIKQVILDMQNQLLQVKTQVAIAIADQHLLEKKHKENLEKADEWTRKANLAVQKKQDDLARAAIERSLSCKQNSLNFEQQVADQKIEVENLKSALRKLEQKLEEAQAKMDMLIAQARRSRVVGKARAAQSAAGNEKHIATFDRMKDKVVRSQAVNEAHQELTGDSIDDRFATLEREDEIERLLTEIKNKHASA
jgi:phage shock protein A